MRLLSYLAILSLLACHQSGGPGTPDECVGDACEAAYGSSGDQSSLLPLTRTYTNSRDIEVSWAEVPGVTEYVLHVALDDLCIAPIQSLPVVGTTAHLIDLEEGIYYLCLSPSVGRSQKLVVDRQGPQIEAVAAQNLASGSSAAVRVYDRSEAQCSWSSSNDRLKIAQSDSVMSTFSADASGTYSATLDCEDLAENTSSVEFALTLTVAGTPPPASTPPSPVKSLSATAAANSISLSWADGGGAASYLVLSGATAVTAVPTDGMVYAVGSSFGGFLVKATSTATTYNETGIAGNTQRFFKVFALNAAGRYSTGAEANAVAIASKGLKATLTRTGNLNYNETVGLRTVGNTSFVCRGDSGLAAVNVANPAAPTQVSLSGLGNNTSNGWCSDVKVVGNYAYVADWSRGFIIVDITNPSAPIQRGSVMVTNASVVYVEGTTAYVAFEDGGASGGIAVINVANPNSPFQMSSMTTGGNASGIAKVGNFVYLTHRNSGSFAGLKIIDVTNPSGIFVTKTMMNGTNMEEIEIKDGFAYATVGTGGFAILDVTTPNNPVTKSTTALNGNGRALSVNVSDNFAFVADTDNNRLQIFDITNKAAPVSVRTYQAQDRLKYVHVSGNHAYLSVNTKGLDIVEVFQQQ